ncbi:MAG: hypothetical protein OXR64_13090 [Chloroflexota bacterium]|nr:hypothetical protein [Chloroflexota bacterium]MDE2920764.1 hypothetical protein [Chloroflexota bacterium]MYA60266.1 hypothetical protein [Chloroflexota bacterium]
MTVDLTAIEIERRLTAIETALPTFATKADIQSLRAEIQASRAEWKSDLHSLTRWMVIAVLGSVTAAATITGLIVRFVGT